MMTNEVSLKDFQKKLIMYEVDEDVNTHYYTDSSKGKYDMDKEAYLLLVERDGIKIENIPRDKLTDNEIKTHKLKVNGNMVEIPWDDINVEVNFYTSKKEFVRALTKYEDNIDGYMWTRAKLHEIDRIEPIQQ